MRLTPFYVALRGVLVSADAKHHNHRYFQQTDGAGSGCLVALNVRRVECPSRCGGISESNFFVEKLQIKMSKQK